MEEQEVPFSQKCTTILSEKLGELCFACKDLFCNHNSFRLVSTRKNLVSKIYTPKMGTNKPVVFLFAPSFFNTQRMMEVVIGCLKSANKEGYTDIQINNEFVDGLYEFIRHKNTISVELSNSSISLLGDGYNLQVFDVQEMDTPARNMLMRSFCLLLAYCGKNVKNNKDCVVLNDFGVVNIDSSLIPDKKKMEEENED